MFRVYHCQRLVPLPLKGLGFTIVNGLGSRVEG